MADAAEPDAVLAPAESGDSPAHASVTRWELFTGFVLVGMLWVGHHNMFLTIKRHDRTLLWLNNFFLLAVATMPFFAGLLAHHTTKARASYFLALVRQHIDRSGFWEPPRAG